MKLWAWFLDWNKLFLGFAILKTLTFNSCLNFSIHISENLQWGKSFSLSKPMTSLISDITFCTKIPHLPQWRWPFYRFALFTYDSDARFLILWPNCNMTSISACKSLIFFLAFSFSINWSPVNEQTSQSQMKFQFLSLVCLSSLDTPAL